MESLIYVLAVICGFIRNVNSKLESVISGEMLLVACLGTVIAFTVVSFIKLVKPREFYSLVKKINSLNRNLNLKRVFNKTINDYTIIPRDHSYIDEMDAFQEALWTYVVNENNYPIQFRLSLFKLFHIDIDSLEMNYEGGWTIGYVSTSRGKYLFA